MLPRDLNLKRALLPKVCAGVSVMLTAALFAVGSLSAAELPEKLRELDGRWTGWGAITMENGVSEQVKCIATYFPREDGREITQNLRCASKSYRIDSQAELKVEDSGLVGRWVERTYEAEGTVSGRFTGQGFNLSIRGNGFAAAMVVTASACKQSITISPEGFSIQRIAVVLQKC